MIVSHARSPFASALVFALVLTAAACGGGGESADSAESKTTPGAGQDSEEPLPPSELDTLLPPEVRDVVLKPFTGDFDEMVKRRLVRVGVTYNRTFYFVDHGVQRGIAYEYGQLDGGAAERAAQDRQHQGPRGLRADAARQAAAGARRRQGRHGGGAA